jgi:hypothetical protein
MTTYQSIEFTILLAILGAGLFLVVSGYRGRRIGSMPHCRACDFNLTGVEYDSCPECGGHLSAGMTVYGEATPSPIYLVTGLITLIICGILMYRSAREVNWRRHYPDSWLLAECKSMNVNQSSSAWDELQRRMKLDGLSMREEDALIEITLGKTAKEARSGRFGYLYRYHRFLVQAYWRKMSIAQRTAFLRSQVFVSLKVRPRVKVGDDIPVELAMRTNPHPGLDLRARLETVSIYVDGAPTGFDTPWGLREGETFSAGQATALGDHEVSIDPELTVEIRDRTAIEQSGLFRVIQTPLKAKFEVVEDETVVMVEDPSIREEFFRALWLNVTASETVIGDKTTTWIKVEPKFAKGARLPIDVAGELYFRIDDMEIFVDDFAAWNTSTKTIREFQWDDSAPSSLDVVILGSADVAKNTTNLSRILKGDLVFCDLPVKVRERRHVTWWLYPPIPG